MSAEQSPVAGDRVGVPWGLDVLEGVVLRTYRTGSSVRAVVSVDVPGTDDEPRTVTLRATDLVPIDEGHELTAPGSWVNEYQFSKAVQAALARAVSRFTDRAEVENEPRLGGRRADAIVRFGDHLVVVEVKTTADVTAAIGQLAEYLEETRSRNPGTSVGGMLVIQSEPTAQTIEDLQSQGLAAVSWSTPRDDPKLTAELTRLLEAA
jgi:hypothetical protein